MTALPRALLSALALALAGCSASRPVVEAQTPGLASGAGATLTGPGNSAAPTTQEAERVTVYDAQDLPPPDLAPFAAPGVTYQAAPAPAGSRDAPAAEVPGVVTPGRDSSIAGAAWAVTPPLLPRPAYVHERVKTTIGQHQDAAGIIRAAGALAQWGWLRWVGVVCILVGGAGWLWSVGNPAGYPVVFLGVLACGVVFVLASANPAWLLVLLLPVGFYAAQKLGVVRPLP